MIRLLLTFVVPLLLPFIVYAVWGWLRRRQAVARGEPMPDLKGPPVVWLGIVGIGLVILVLGGLSLQRGQGTLGSYAPPHVENGRIVPGTMK
ncbi:hypothetical protein VZ95_16450 [Elstera litoralis]|uniref:Uncharacterized protein n=1 Tax=Elstera litoralis TaxID=552518 RepID=A0A0F3IPV4_9PROT|nr:DUF6111 family protein [Elstera litoralis]KJV08647.1 hypothetical protein VZ95_16450 [Elstera litoralis]